MINVMKGWGPFYIGWLGKDSLRKGDVLTKNQGGKGAPNCDNLRKGVPSRVNNKCKGHEINLGCLRNGGGWHIVRQHG